MSILLWNDPFIRQHPLRSHKLMGFQLYFIVCLQLCQFYWALLNHGPREVSWTYYWFVVVLPIMPVTEDYKRFWCTLFAKGRSFCPGFCWHCNFEELDLAEWWHYLWPFFWRQSAQKMKSDNKAYISHWENGGLSYRDKNNYFLRMAANSGMKTVWKQLSL